MVASALVVVFGVVFTATHVGLALRLRARVPRRRARRPRAVLDDAEVRRAALRAADAAQPQARAGLALDPRPARRPRVRARRPEASAPAPRRRARTSPAASRCSSTPDEQRSDPPLIQVAAAGWRRVKRRYGRRLLRRLCASWRAPSWLIALGGRRCVGRARPAAVGHRPRAAVRLQRRRERALRAARDRDVRALLQPEYFINPPAFTYLLHARSGCAGAAATAVGDAFAADPTATLRRSRACCRAVLGAAAVGFLPWAGRAAVRPARRARRGGAAGRRVPAGPLLAPALNDVPTLAPLCLALVGIAGVYRARAGCATTRSPAPALGVACATKYTAGIVLLPLLAAARSRTPAPVRGAGCAGAACCALGGFVVANPYALLDFDAFRDGLERAVGGVERRRRQARPHGDSGIVYYLGTLTGGSAGCPRSRRPRRRRRLSRSRPPARARARAAPVVFLVFMGTQDRFFARWLLPVYPLLCLLAAWAAVAAWPSALARPAARCGRGVGGAAVRAGARVLGPQRPRARPRRHARTLARDWMVENVPEGSKVVIEPIVPDQWAMDAGRPSRGTGNGNRWIKWPTSRYPRAAASSSSRTTSARSRRRPARPTRAAATAGSSPARPSTAAR